MEYYTSSLITPKSKVLFGEWNRVRFFSTRVFHRRKERLLQFFCQQNVALTHKRLRAPLSLSPFLLPTALLFHFSSHIFGTQFYFIFIFLYFFPFTCFSCIHTHTHKENSFSINQLIKKHKTNWVVVFTFASNKQRMADSEERTQNPWMASDQTTQRFTPPTPPSQSSSSDKLGIGERAFSAAGAAFLSAVIVNPLDVAKVALSSLLYV